MKNPGIIIYDQFPGGIGLTQYLFSRIEDVFNYLRDIIKQCPCSKGCPSCVGPPGENGLGAKKGTFELIKKLTNNCIYDE